MGVGMTRGDLDSFGLPAERDLNVSGYQRGGGVSVGRSGGGGGGRAVEGGRGAMEGGHKGAVTCRERRHGVTSPRVRS